MNPSGAPSPMVYIYLSLWRAECSKTHIARWYYYDMAVLLTPVRLLAILLQSHPRNSRPLGFSSSWILVLSDSRPLGFSSSRVSSSRSRPPVFSFSCSPILVPPRSLGFSDSRPLGFSDSLAISFGQTLEHTDIEVHVRATHGHARNIRTCA
jgi:hypothetical protein